MSVHTAASAHPPVNNATALESKTGMAKYTSHATSATATAAARSSGNPEVYAKYNNAMCPTWTPTTYHPRTQAELCATAFTIQNQGSDSCPGRFMVPLSEVPGGKLKVCGPTSNPNVPCLPPGQDLQQIYCDPDNMVNVSIGKMGIGSVQAEPSLIAVPTSAVNQIGENLVGCYSNHPPHRDDPHKRVAYTKTTSSIAQASVGPRIIQG